MIKSYVFNYLLENKKMSASKCYFVPGGAECVKYKEIPSTPQHENQPVVAALSQNNKISPEKHNKVNIVKFN